MKMPFGKYKGTELEKLPTDYLIWLRGLKLIDPLKSSLTPIFESESFRKAELGRIEMAIRAEENRQNEIDYSEDLNFWTHASPAAAYDYLNKTGKKRDVPLDDWKYLCETLQRRGY